MWRLTFLRDWLFTRPDPLIDWYLRRARRWMADNATREDEL